MVLHAKMPLNHRHSSDERGAKRILLLVGILFLLLDFFHGVFSSGFVPILHEALSTQATFALAIYYIGLAIGQLAIYFYAPFSKSKYNYPVYEIAFGCSLIFMAFYTTPMGLIVGRLLEGIAGGMTTPLIFASLIKIEALGPPARRIALFNSVLALGYVMGPPLVAYPMHWWPVGQLLWIAGLFFIMTPIVLFFLPVPSPNPEGGVSKDSLKFSAIFGKKWFHKFYPLFLFKCVMGFVMSFAAGYLTQYITNIPLTTLLFLFSVIFIIGQIAGEFTLKLLPKEHLETYVPVLLAGILGMFFLTHSPIWIALLAFFLSLMALIGYLSFSFKATSAREFALFNSLSDPAMALGAILAILGINGVWGLIPLLIYPLFHAMRMSRSDARPEYFYPFVGPILMLKAFQKQKSPLLSPSADSVTESLSYTYSQPEEQETKSAKLSLVFAGDFCPLESPAPFSKEIQEALQKADLKFVNLEGPIAKQPGGKHIHGFPEAYLKPILNQKTGFNMINCVNNHVFDQGREGFENTLKFIEEEGQTPITSKLKTVTVNGVKVGCFGLTFGVNKFWVKDERIARVKPAELLNNDLIRTTWEELIHGYKNEVDLLILSFHWGYEAEVFPSHDQEACLKLLFDAGVDLVYGHHGHIIQPFEIQGNQKLGMYSCGDLLGTKSADIYKQGVLFQVELASDLTIQSVAPIFVEAQNQEKGALPQEQVLAFQSLKKAQ